MPVLLLGGIYSGVFTPTEARRSPRSTLWRSRSSCTRTRLEGLVSVLRRRARSRHGAGSSCGAFLFNYVLATEQMPARLANGSCRSISADRISHRRDTSFFWCSAAMLDTTPLLS